MGPHCTHANRARRRAWPLCFASIALALACIVPVHQILAQADASAPQPITPVVQFNGNVMQLPQKLPASRQSGLRLSIDARWSNNYGYQPVEVTISSTKPVASEHLVTIQLHAGWNRNISVEQEFELPKGSTKTSTSITLPIYQTAQNYYWWDLWIDGVRDKDLSIDRVSALSFLGGSGSSADASVNLLVPGPKKNHRLLVTTNPTELEVLSLEISAFPARWIDYTSFDVVAISLGEAQQLANNRPAVFQAICRWVRSGGQLWITDVGAELEHLSEVSKLLGIPKAMVDESVETASEEVTTQATVENGKAGGQEAAETNHSLLQEGWRSARFRRFSPNGQVVTFLDSRSGTRRTVRDPDLIARMQRDPDMVTAEQHFESESGRRGRGFASDSSEWFVQQDFGLGTIRAFRGANEAAKIPLSPAAANANTAATSGPPNGPPEQLPRALAIGLRRTQRWDTRHGMTPDSANTEFAKFLVPGVGLAPVTEFRVLITLFVLLIGPVNYWFLKRVKRLHLMVLTVPLAALVTTLALFAYAILADGFDTRVRAQSFTTLDQRTGEAACWTRLSYYSGLAPGNGLSMPADVALYPILPAWAGDLNFAEERQVIWAPDGARLKQGWLNSRTPTQYLTVRAEDTAPH